jgi:hypothetical protein
MRLFFITNLAAGAIVTVVTSSNLSAAPASGAAILDAVQMTTTVEDIGYCTRTNGRGRIISRSQGHCPGRGVTCWSGVPHRSHFLHGGLCRRGEGGF